MPPAAQNAALDNGQHNAKKTGAGETPVQPEIATRTHAQNNTPRVHVHQGWAQLVTAYIQQSRQGGPHVA
jgi:hypothetical protein